MVACQPGTLTLRLQSSVSSLSAKFWLVPVGLARNYGFGVEAESVCRVFERARLQGPPERPVLAFWGGAAPNRRQDSRPLGPEGLALSG